MKRLLVVAIAAVMLAAGPGTSLAGEVKGPPGTPDNTNSTAAPSHANSACAFSGLNDLDPAEGQNASQVQTAAEGNGIKRKPFISDFVNVTPRSAGQINVEARSPLSAHQGEKKMAGGEINRANLKNRWPGAGFGN